jgi:excisionase family DNA binding protein
LSPESRPEWAAQGKPMTRSQPAKTDPTARRPEALTPAGRTRPASSDRLLSAEEVAAYLQVPLKTLYQWRLKGTGPRGLRVGRHLRYRRDEVDGWLDGLGR